MTDLFNRPPQWQPEGFDPQTLPRDEQLIFGIMAFHAGRRRAIAVPELVTMSGLNERTIRSVLKSLTETHGLGIATTTKPPYGAYLIETAEELEDYCLQLQSRGLSILRRMALLKRQHLDELIGQLNLGEGGEAS